ncbi:cytochrome P450 [Infundibulicybe gibba]|nr:cytochrome P450 [Infundibulicybe gibba]
MSYILFSWLVVIATTIAYRRWQISRRPPLPPGPKGLPLLGNIRDIPSSRQWLAYTEWAKVYGEIVYLEALGKPLVILNTLNAARELLERRSSIYSDRPHMVMANDLMGWTWDFGHLSYSDLWRRHRKMFHQYFQHNAVSEFTHLQVAATSDMVLKLLENPDNFGSHVRHCIGSTVLKIVYGYDIKPENDEYVLLADEAAQGLTQVIAAGTYLVDFIPILKYIPDWFPGANFKRQAKIWGKSAEELKEIPFRDFKQVMVSVLAQRFIWPHKASSGIGYAMLHYPEVQSRAQAELESVIGKSRLPDFGDKASLPYLSAVLSETLRWHPIAPIGAAVMANVWAIQHDETMYPEPFKFKPERYLGEEKAPDPAETGAFGFGRRICPGRHLAINSVWLAIAYILATFDLKRAVDANGVEEDAPPIEYTDGIIIHPKPFRLRFIPRSAEALALIQSAKEGAA